MHVNLQPRRLLRFDAFELDLRAGELRKHGKRLRLQEQPLQVLRLLLESSGELVTREELQQKLWPADTFVDFDDGLNTAVKKLRDALGDSADRPRYIETLPRRGYRFIGAVAATQDAGALPTLPSQPADDALSADKNRAVGRLHWHRIALTFGVLALLLTGWKLFQSSARAPAAETTAIRSIAVLPLENLSGDPAQDYFAAGLTDTLTTELARVGSLRVTSRTSAVRFRGQPLAKITHDLDVDAIIEGSVARSGNRVRVNAQLIQARTDKHIWAASYERDLPDLIALEGEIARDIAGQVQSTITLQGRTGAHRKVDPQAYDFYLRAVPHLGQNNKADNDAAMELLEKSVAADPAFALGHAALAIEYRTRATEFASYQREYRERASVAVERALALDPDLPEAYLARARLLWTKPNHFPHEAAIADLKHALALNPNLAEAHHQLGNIYNHVGLLEKGQQQIEAAVSLDPTNAGTRFRVGINLLYQGKWQEALLRMRSGKEFFPSLWAYQSAFALVQLGRTDDAKELIRNAVKQDTPEVAGLLETMEAVLAAKAGDARQADDRIRAAIQNGEQFQHFHHVAYGIGSAYALMNRREQALSWLRRAADDGFPCYPLFVKDHNLDSLRQDPRFVDFMKDLERRWKHYSALP